ncbi:hypothetical protein [Streptomyces sp. NPDC058653]|uniref:hypothetical protein n=1 Tax=Streptomyces sp. NPDC058653 TaxID=3346576 RepID=UPI003664C90F
MPTPPRRRTTQGNLARVVFKAASQEAAARATKIRTECDAIDAATDDPAIREATARIRAALDEPAN